MRIACFGLALMLSASVAWATESCHPAVDAGRPQFSVGYGSLMEEASRLRTAPNTGQALPALVTGFERSFNSLGSSIGFSTTYLGVTPNSSATMTAAVYQVFRLEDVLSTDEREANYCRQAVAPENIRLLDGSDVLVDAQYWIYVNKPDYRAPASERMPLVQSYIDIFLTGCQQLAQKAIRFEGNFVVECLRSTKGWSTHWVNDRLYPRRPFIYQPNAGFIDRLLSEHVPEFKFVRIE